MDEVFSAEDAIRDDYLETYKSLQDVIWGQLVIFNSNLFTLERLESFPLKIFVPLYDDRVFWQTVQRALVEATIMIAWRITLDQDNRSLTLRGFAEEVFNNLRNDDMREKLKSKKLSLRIELRVLRKR